MTSPQGFAFYPPGSSPPAARTSTRPQIITRAAQLEGAALVARVGAPASGVVWSVRRITVTGPAGSTARVYVGDPADLSSYVDGTRAGAGDVAEYVVPVLVLDQAPVAVVWTRATAFVADEGATARVELLEQG